MSTYEYAAMMKDEYNAAAGRLGRKTRPKRDLQPPSLVIFQYLILTAQSTLC